VPPAYRHYGALQVHDMPTVMPALSTPVKTTPGIGGHGCGLPRESQSSIRHTIWSASMEVSHSPPSANAAQWGADFRNAYREPELGAMVVNSWPTGRSLNRSRLGIVVNHFHRVSIRGDQARALWRGAGVLCGGDRAAHDPSHPREDEQTTERPHG